MVQPKKKTTKPKRTNKYLGLINDRPHISILIGRKGSGKSALLIKLLRDRNAYRGIYDDIIIVSPTFKLQAIWNTISTEGVTIHESFSTEVLDKIYSDKQSNPKKNTLLILDDNGEDLKRIDQKNLNKLISNSRHVLLSVVILLQKVSQAPTIVRSNADSFVCFAATSTRETDIIHAEIGILEKKDFQQIFRDATGDRYSFFVCSMVDGKLRFYKNYAVEYK
jgi:hypothetical protein